MAALVAGLAASVGSRSPPTRVDKVLPSRPVRAVLQRLRSPNYRLKKWKATTTLAFSVFAHCHLDGFFKFLSGVSAGEELQNAVMLQHLGYSRSKSGLIISHLSHSNDSPAMFRPSCRIRSQRTANNPRFEWVGYYRIRDLPTTVGRIPMLRRVRCASDRRTRSYKTYECTAYQGSSTERRMPRAALMKTLSRVSSRVAF